MINEDITRLLQASQEGDKEAIDRLMPVLYKELRKLSQHYLNHADRPQTIQATALVHEAYIKLLDQNRTTWKNRAHFMGVAAQIIRRVLLNYWTERKAQKRGGDMLFLSLEKALDNAEDRNIDLEALNEAIEALEQIDARKSRIVELKFYGGLTEDEVAEVLQVSPSTVRRDWESARAWLYRFIKPKNR